MFDTELLLGLVGLLLLLLWQHWSIGLVNNLVGHYYHASILLFIGQRNRTNWESTGFKGRWSVSSDKFWLSVEESRSGECLTGDYSFQGSIDTKFVLY